MSQLPGAPEAAYHVAAPSGQEGPMTLDQLLDGVLSGRWLDTVPGVVGGPSGMGRARLAA